VIVLDTETSGLDLWRDARMFAFSTSNMDGDKVQVWRFDKGTRRKRLADDALEEALNDQPIIFHNSKFDIKAIENHIDKKIGEELDFHDTILMSQILQNNHPNHRLKELAWELAGFTRNDERAVKNFTKKGMDWPKVPEFIMKEYQGNDVLRTLLLHLFFWPKIRENPDYLSYYREMCRLQITTMRIQDRGVVLSIPACLSMMEQLKNECEGMLDRLEHKTGRRLNPLRPADVKWLLYNKLKLPIVKYTKKTREPSIDKEVFLELNRVCKDNELLGLIQNFKSWRRGISTFKGYLRAVDKDNVIHPNINTHGAITGRESCSNPNLQNVQKSDALLNPYPVPERKVFRPRPGHVNFLGDYAGIEMRLLIHYSEEPELVKIAQENGDVHLPAAQIFFGDRFEQAEGKERKTLRSAAKNCNFAVPYGAGLSTAADALGMTEDKASLVFRAYKGRFPLLTGLGRRIAQFVRENGYVETVFGTTIYCPMDKAYMGLNYLIQGTAAALFKIGQNRVKDVLEEMTGDSAGIILPVHDELIIEYERKILYKVHKVLSRVRDVMIDFPQFNIPLDVEWNVSTRSWEEKREFKLEAI